MLIHYVDILYIFIDIIAFNIFINQQWRNFIEEYKNSELFTPLTNIMLKIQCKFPY